MRGPRMRRRAASLPGRISVRVCRAAAATTVALVEKRGEIPIEYPSSDRILVRSVVEHVRVRRKVRRRRPGPGVGQPFPFGVLALIVRRRWGHVTSPIEKPGGFRIFLIFLKCSFFNIFLNLTRFRNLIRDSRSSWIVDVIHSTP